MHPVDGGGDGQGFPLMEWIWHFLPPVGPMPKTPQRPLGKAYSGSSRIWHGLCGWAVGGNE